MDVTKDYWMTVNKVGADASNTYKWYHDSSGANSHGESADGETWSEITSSWKPSYRLYYGVPISTASKHDVNYGKYGKRGYTVVQDSIVDKSTAKRLAKALAARLGELETSISSLNILQPTAVPIAGEQVSVTYSDLGVSGFFTVKNIHLDFPKGEASVERMSLGVTV